MTLTDTDPDTDPAARRILHVSQPVTEGVAVVLADLAEFQRANGWDVHVACPYSGWLVNRLNQNGISVHEWNATRSPGLSALAEVRELMAVVRRVRPDVVHLHSSKAGLAGRLALRGTVTTVFQPHAWSFLASGKVMARASAVWERLAVRWTDLVVAVSGGELHEGYRRGIEPRRTVIAPNGVDVHRFAPQDQADARARLGLGPQPLAVCIGRLARQKGQDLLLDCWPQVVEQIPNAQLALVGDGPEHERLLASGGAGVRLHGNTSVPEDWYAAADVVVVPSRWEGMALVALEAMACERCVVGFDVAGLAESVGDAGAIVPAEDTESLARALTRRLADTELSAREGRRGRARVVTLYDRAKAVAVTDEAIRSLLDGLHRARSAGR
jgi:glycosyltransferase involved in cell wall biosynthesis